MRKRALWSFVALTFALALLALALLTGGAAAGKGKGHGNHHGSGENGQTGFHFLVLNASGATDRLLIQGDGSFNGQRAHGGGTFDHFQTTGSPPLPLVASGTWKATDVVSFTAGTSHGVFEGGTLMIHATFFPNGQAPIQNVLIEVDCNLGPAGFNTGKPEGVVVTIPGSPQTVFSPTSPTTGVTIFTLATGEHENDNDGD